MMCDMRCAYGAAMNIIKILNLIADEHRLIVLNLKTLIVLP